MHPIRTQAGRKPVVREMNQMLYVPNGAVEMQLLHEALSRARMPRPQAGRTTTSTEATRSARTVAMSSRNQAARDLGVL
ncbi:hypothetical protein EV384_6751 [Micromonospora kangleipakensis]|uniref:Uncharacterized protein n=1 Tax=Micromonospora kangleipakensis TaxID=1077942 RepID=A0A4Q8BK99_9ACTN|nr:hypothetical protein EV384_6751 [Micromonospora kangleipakensis]